MRAYIIRRLLLTIPTMLIVTILVFLTVRLIPGDVIDLMLQGHASKMASGTEYELTAADLRHELGLDEPIHIQYVRWMGRVLQGDLGRSLWTNIPVTDEIKRRLPVSAELGILGIVTALIIALPIGIYSAIRQDTGGDYLARSFAIACIALPSFWLGTMVMVFPSVWWQWSPAMQYVSLVENPLANLGQFMIPAFILGMALSGTTMRMTRTMMLEVLRQDYIRTAWSKGLTERVVIMRHALKNALIPVTTIVGMNLPVVIGGAVVLEQIFNLPGVGRLALDVINDRDYTVLSGINLFMATFVLGINLVVDITYAFLDPRVHYK